MTDSLFNPEAFEQMPGQISMEQDEPVRETSAEYVERWEREFAESLERVREGQRIMRRGRL